MKKIIKMVTFGSDLSGREFGKSAFSKIVLQGELPMTLDFSDVSSIGSSFADEVVAEIARLQESKIIIINANRVVKSCLNDVADDKKIKIEYQTTQMHQNI